MAKVEFPSAGAEFTPIVACPAHPAVGVPYRVTPGNWHGAGRLAKATPRTASSSGAAVLTAGAMASGGCAKVSNGFMNGLQVGTPLVARGESHLPCAPETSRVHVAVRPRPPGLHAFTWSPAFSARSRLERQGTVHRAGSVGP